MARLSAVAVAAVLSAAHVVTARLRRRLGLNGAVRRISRRLGLSWVVGRVCRRLGLREFSMWIVNLPCDFIMLLH